MHFVKSRSATAIAETASNLAPEVRRQREKALRDYDRRKRLDAASREVEAARVALHRVRDVSAEQAALDAALKRLAEIEAEPV